MSDDHHADEDRPEEPVGDLGEEAARLLAVLAGWTRSVDEHVATGAPECQWCPVCRVVHVVRSSSPEVRDHLVTAASSLLQAASGLLAAAGREPDHDAPGGRDGPDGGGRAGHVEHIDLDGEAPGPRRRGHDQPDHQPGERPDQHPDDEEGRP